MKTQFFFVVYLHDDALKTYFDCLRLVADSKQKNFAHITVKGPYKTHQQKLLEDDSKHVSGEKVTIQGIGNFFEENQNTVFFKCEDNKPLYDVWKRKEEKTYKEFHPHITIYDGSDRLYATRLFETMKLYSINFSFVIDKLELYSTKLKNDNHLYNLKNSESCYRLISELIGRNVNYSDIDNFTASERLHIVSSICKNLEQRISSTRNKKKVQDETHAFSELLLEV